LISVYDENKLCSSLHKSRTALNMSLIIAYVNFKKQESRAAARKPRDVEAILFGLMFANRTNFTKQKDCV